MTRTQTEARIVAEQNWRRIGDLDADERAVIRERHFGWEKAKPSLLADIFQCSIGTITAVLRRGPE